MPSAGGMGGSPGGSGGFVENKMVVVDVVILSTEEQNNSSMGVNLLDSLKIQFGGIVGGVQTAPAWSRTTTTNTGNDLGSAAGIANNSITNNSATAITSMISIPALSYSLNIANSNSSRNEVLARPTLVALGNQASQFFSGTDVNAAAVSGGQGQPVTIQKQVGIKLAVTPEFLPDSQIKLNVSAERTFLTIPSASVQFDFRMDTTMTTVTANVVMKFGETLILSGLSERDSSTTRDGVPFLQDIPLIQYFFSQKNTQDYYKSVLILLTPRRAEYTNRSDADVAAEKGQMSPEELAQAEFEAKYKPWFQPTPNIGEIARGLDRSMLYREFRSGDLGGSWRGVSSTGERLRDALKFLYY